MSDTTRQPRTPLEWAKHVRRYDLTPSAPNPLAEALEQQAAQIAEKDAEIAVLRADAERLRSGMWEVADGLRTKANNNIHIKSSTLDSFAADLDALRQEQPSNNSPTT